MDLSKLDFSNVNNRNRKRVLKVMQEYFEELAGYRDLPELKEKDVQDILALSLNLLPARYMINGTIVLGDPVKDDDLRSVVEEAYQTVRARPKS